MYQKQRNFRSFRSGPNRFSRPSSNGHFGKPKNFSRSLPNNPNLFIKKAVEISPTETFVSHHTFNDFDLVPALKENISKHGYNSPTPIQDQAIQPILEGRDLIGLANTGTGKTAAFLIPLINKIYKDRNQKALIIVPTRELAAQIYDELRIMTSDMKIYSALIIGGANIRRQMEIVRRKPHVVIATPGRLRDLIQKRTIFLENFSTFVLDEVDLMVDIGFIDDIKYFISLLPKIRQSLFFSATIPRKVHEILQSFVVNPITVSVTQQATAENIDQDVIKITGQETKIEQLYNLLISEGFHKVLIFGRTKHGVEKLNKQLEERGFKVGAIHGNKTQSHRQKTLQSFKNNEIRILLATDVASRGLDIPDVTHVINYELPQTYKDYIHRIGRTGRAGKTGKALTFI